MIDLALDGDIHALRLCLDRLVPPRKDRAIDLSLPPLEDINQISSAVSTIMKAVGVGQITPTEGETLAHIVATQCDVITTKDLYRRVEALEQAIPNEKTDKAQEDAREKVQTEEIVRRQHAALLRKFEAKSQRPEDEHPMQAHSLVRRVAQLEPGFGPLEATPYPPPGENPVFPLSFTGAPASLPGGSFR